MNAENLPLIVQGDGSLLLDVHEDSFETARGEISAFAELEKSPEHFHTYRITPLSLWNAAGAGWDFPRVDATLSRWSRYPVPDNVRTQAREILSRWGKLLLVADSDEPPDTEIAHSERSLRLLVNDENIVEELKARKSLSKWLTPAPDGFRVRLVDRGTVKAELIRIGFPVNDLAPLADGEPLEVQLKTAEEAAGFHVRDYQHDAVRSFLGTGEPGTGFGTVVMPCGSGKTIVGIAALVEMGTSTLILTTNVAAVHQWRAELLDKTSLKPEEIAEYSGYHCHLPDTHMAPG